MRSDELLKFKDLLTDVLAYYGKDCSQFTLDAFWGALGNFSYEQVEKAMQRHATDPERGQFTPKVADIVRALGGTTTDRAAIAWGKVFEAIGAVGAMQDVVFDDPAIHAAIEDMGGWPKVCRTETKEISYTQHRFQEAHKAYTARGEFDYPRRLHGARDPDSEYESRGLPLPRPYLVGERDKCIAVLKLGQASGKQQIQQLPRSDLRALIASSPLMLGNHAHRGRV
jgi:hypothetical protein